MTQLQFSFATKLPIRNVLSVLSNMHSQQAVRLCVQHADYPPPGHQARGGTLGVIPPAASLQSVPLMSVSSHSVPLMSAYQPLIPRMSAPSTSTPWQQLASGSAPVWPLPQSVAPLTTSAGWTGPTTTNTWWAVPQPTPWTQSSPLLQEAPAAVALSPASEPFPQKLVARILSGQFVEMKDLLMDNISLLQQLETMGGQLPLALPGVMKPRLREVSTLPTWIYCFLAYAAIRCPDPRTRDMLAYARLVVREAQRHGGNGWLDYDRVFRQQPALDHALPWNSLHPGIQAATLVGQGTGASVFCTLCREPDHLQDRCALTYLQQPQPQPTPTPTTQPGLPKARVQQKSRADLQAGICTSWNKGACIYPTSCTYLHVCSHCFQRHRAKDCRKTQAVQRGQEVEAQPPKQPAHPR